MKKALVLTVDITVNFNDLQAIRRFGYEDIAPKVCPSEYTLDGMFCIRSGYMDQIAEDILKQAVKTESDVIVDSSRGLGDLVKRLRDLRNRIYKEALIIELP